MMRQALVWILVASSLPVLSGCIGVQAGDPAGDGPTLAETMMWSASYPILVVEVDAAAGMAPSPEQMAELQATLQELTGRERVVLYGPSTIDPPGLDDLRDLARLHRATADAASTQRGVHAEAGVATLHLLYLPDHVERRASAAGITLYEHGTIAVFPDAYRDLHHLENGQMKPAADALGRLVLMHEVGHALGLLDRGAPMLTPREDPDHPGHSLEPESVMSAGHRAHNGLLHGDLEKTFTAADRADLAALAAMDPAR